MRRLTNPRSLARAVRSTVIAEYHWNQAIWMSSKWFATEKSGLPQATGTALRKLMTANVCGTTACVAGHTIVLTLPSKARYDYSTDTVIEPDGTKIFAQNYARKALGLTMTEADWLFDCRRQKSDVLAALDLIAAGKNLDTLIPYW
jgi:hypothetical protein